MSPQFLQKFTLAKGFTSTQPKVKNKFFEKIIFIKYFKVTLNEVRKLKLKYMWKVNLKMETLSKYKNSQYVKKLFLKFYLELEFLLAMVSLLLSKNISCSYFD